MPILRVVFCDGSTASLVPAELWRGRFTVDSVLETVVHVLRDGVQDAYNWTWYGGTGDCVVSRRSLRRWRAIVRQRLIGSALAWLGPRLGFSWSDAGDEATQLETLLDQLTAAVLIGFRAVAGRAALDQPLTPRPAHTRSPVRRLAGRLLPAPPPTTPSSRKRRGLWSRPIRRRNTRRDRKEVRPP